MIAARSLSVYLGELRGSPCSGSPKLAESCSWMGKWGFSGRSGALEGLRESHYRFIYASISGLHPLRNSFKRL